MYSVRQYTSADFVVWNTFVAASKNGTFLFHRNFMEYHADRFADFSLMVFNGQKLVALLPANRVGNTVHSHQGLTYGGLVLEGSPGQEKTEHIFISLCRFMNKYGIMTLRIKQQPVIYHKEPAHEVDYLLVKSNGQLYRRDMNLAVPLQEAFTINPAKLKRYRQALQSEIEIRADNNFDIFWDEVLSPRLMEKHGAHPVHTKQEIQLLHSFFPENILQYNVYFKGRVVAGITLFIFNGVVKSQYGSTTAIGEKLRALDYLFISLINSYRLQGFAFFDMGTVTEGVNDYNRGLIKQKEELGCRVYLQDFYELTVAKVIAN
jgi:hypothetical protein